MHIKVDQMILDKINLYETKSRIKDTLKPMDKINKLNVTSFNLNSCFKIIFWIQGTEAK